MSKPKCPKCKNASLLFFGKLNRVECRHLLDCGWRKIVSRAAIIRLATQPKPETCKWTAGFKEDLPWHWAACGTPMRPDPKLKFCGNCGKPVEVVNG